LPASRPPASKDRGLSCARHHLRNTTTTTVKSDCHFKAVHGHLVFQSWYVALSLALKETGYLLNVVETMRLTRRLDERWRRRKLQTRTMTSLESAVYGDFGREGKIPPNEHRGVHMLAPTRSIFFLLFVFVVLCVFPFMSFFCLWEFFSFRRVRFFLLKHFFFPSRSDGTIVNFGYILHRHQQHNDEHHVVQVAPRVRVPTFYSFTRMILPVFKCNQRPS
jgi:hypothetical protein